MKGQFGCTLKMSTGIIGMARWEKIIQIDFSLIAKFVGINDISQDKSVVESSEVPSKQKTHSCRTVQSAEYN
jgi:hypothetical protein